MKSLALLISIVGSVALAGSQHGNCFESVVKKEKLNSFSKNEWSCLTQFSGFNSALTALCAQDNSTVTAEYQKYLDAEAAYLKAFEDFRAANDPGSRLSAQTKMNRAERDWSINGYRMEISAALNTINSAHYNCSQHP